MRWKILVQLLWNLQCRHSFTFVFRTTFVIRHHCESPTYTTGIYGESNWNILVLRATLGGVTSSFTRPPGITRLSFRTLNFHNFLPWYYWKVICRMKGYIVDEPNYSLIAVIVTHYARWWNQEVFRNSPWLMVSL